MNRSHVTLPQILVAASTRYANMVPESAAYLALALCDAIGCLPLIVPDSAIELSAEGTVVVTQQGKVVPGPEASQAMRDLFVRLLAVTTGPTPRLAAVARARDLATERGVDTFAAELEASLVPMNRSAGKRSLGRLARETLRAIESGSLALHLQARAGAKEAPAAATAAIAPLMVTPAPLPLPLPRHIVPIPMPPSPITPPPSMMSTHSNSGPFDIPITPTTPGLGLETVATEAQVDSSVFGATPTYREGDCIDVEPAAMQTANESPGFDSANLNTVSCDPTQLSAREVQLDLAPRTPSSELTARVVSTSRRPQRIDTPRNPGDITLTSAGVEPVNNSAFETPAPSAPDDFALQLALGIAHHDFGDCHDGQTQSAPKYHETLPGLAPVTPAPSAPEEPYSAEPLQSFEYVLVTPSALPNAVKLERAIDSAEILEAISLDSDEVLSSGSLVTAAPSQALLDETTESNTQEEPSPIEFRALDVPSDEPSRVDELLGTFGRPEEGEEEMLRRTASSLKELAGLEPTPCAPSVSPAIRVPFLTKKKSPAWLPEDPRQTPALEPAPLVQQPRGWRAKLAVPFALFIALLAGFAVVHWRLPEVVLRWVHPVEAKQPAATTPKQASAEQDVYVEP